MVKKQKYNKTVVERLAQKYEVGSNFIKKAIRGDRTSERAENIKKDYSLMIEDLNKFLNAL